MRRIATARNHVSPLDFITDRFQSQLLRYTIFCLQVFPALMYLSAQVIALKTTFNGIFEMEKDTFYPVILIVGLILAFEWVGGLSSVALTDTFQSAIMVFSLVALPAVVANNFGGWSDIDVDTYPIPEFYQTFSYEAQWNFLQISVSFRFLSYIFSSHRLVLFGLLCSL